MALSGEVCGRSTGDGSFLTSLSLAVAAMPCPLAIFLWFTLTTESLVLGDGVVVDEVFGRKMSICLNSAALSFLGEPWAKVSLLFAG